MRSKTLVLALSALIAIPLINPAHAMRRARTEVLESLKELAEPRVRTLSREIHSYHYHGEPAGQTARYYAPDSSWATDSVNREAQRVFHSNFRHFVRDFGSWLGNGMYTAMDPAITRSYASPNFLDDWTTNYDHPWVMYRVALPSGAKILDVSGSGRIDAETVQKMKELLDCDVSDVPGANLYNMMVVNTERRHGCRVLINELVEELEITAIAYLFSTSLRSLPSCRTATQRAFIITDNLPRGSVRVYSSVLPDGTDSASEERIAIQSIYRRMAGTRPLLWPALDGQNLSDSEVNSHASERLFGCGDHAEDNL